MIDMKRIKQPPVLETIKESYSLENSRNNLHVVDPPANDVDKGWLNFFMQFDKFTLILIGS